MANKTVLLFEGFATRSKGQRRVVVWNCYLDVR